MAHQPPIALIVFSNDMDSYLSNIEVERKIIEEALPFLRVFKDLMDQVSLNRSKVTSLNQLGNMWKLSSLVIINTRNIIRQLLLRVCRVNK